MSTTNSVKGHFKMQNFHEKNRNSLLHINQHSITFTEK